jgi:hypothetical protein
MSASGTKQVTHRLPAAMQLGLRRHILRAASDLNGDTITDYNNTEKIFWQRHF